MGSIVRYNNDMNLIQFHKFKDKELDLFFSICYKMKEQELKEVTLSFSELKLLSNYTNKNLERFIKDLDNTYKKLLQLNFKLETKSKITRFVLFTKYEIEKDERNVKIKINEEFKYILNQLGATYTKFELEQFVNLRSIYSKNLFRILKQWDSLKEKTFELDNFKELLNVPNSYDTSNFNRKVLSPILKELPSFFHDLKLEKIRVGRKIQKLKFSWAVKEMKQAKLIEIEIVISEKLEKTIEKTKKNKFINPILTKKNIKILLEIFNEKILINAFSKAYTEIKKEINFNYLKTFIENTLKQQEIKFTVAKDVEDIETIEEKKKDLKMETREPKEKIKVTREEKKQKYEEYLKENNLEDNKFNKKSFEIVFDKDSEIKKIEEKEVKEKDEEVKISDLPLERQKEIKKMALTMGKIKEREDYFTEYARNVKKIEKDILEEILYLKSSALSNFLKSRAIKELQEKAKKIDYHYALINFWYVNKMSHRMIYPHIKNIVIINDDVNIEEYFKYLNVELEKIGKKEFKIDIDYIYLWLQDINNNAYNILPPKTEEELIKIITIEEVPEEYKVSKKGKKLYGSALMAKLKKYAQENKVEIEYKNEVISFS